MHTDSVNVQRHVPVITSRSDKMYVKRNIDLNGVRHNLNGTDSRIAKISWQDLQKERDAEIHVLSSDCMARYDSATRSMQVLVHAKNSIHHYEFFNVVPRCVMEELL